MDDDFKSELKNSILKTGTTILGIVCKDGVVMAGDRRGTMGNLIFSKDSEKVRVLNDYLVFSGCGSAIKIPFLQPIVYDHGYHLVALAVVMPSAGSPSLF